MAKECTSQSNSPPPPTRERWRHWTKKTQKGANVPTLREIFSFQCPCLSPPTTEGTIVCAEVPIFIWLKMFQTTLVFNRPRLIYQYSSTALKLSGQASIFAVVFIVSKSLLRIEGQINLENLKFMLEY